MNERGGEARNPGGTWRFEEHTADAILHVEAPSLEALFEAAARGLAAAIAGEAARRIEPRERVRVEVEARGVERQLVRFLNELLYLFDTQRFVVAGARVDLRDDAVEATLHGERVEQVEGDMQEVKAATYHGLEVQRTPDGRWTADVVLDL